MSRDYHSEIRKASAEWERLRAQIELSLPLRGQSEEGHRLWSEACSAWHNYRSVLDTFWASESLLRLESGDHELMELAIAYVEEDPYYFRSGYLKKRLFRRLKRVTLSPTQRKRVLAGVLNAIRSHRGSGWLDLCSLAIAFGEADFFEEVTTFATDQSTLVADRARHLIELFKKRKIEPT